MAADTTVQSGDGHEEKVPEEAKDKEPSHESHLDSNELSQWVLGALLRGEAPEQLAKFVAMRVQLEDHDYEALQRHLQQHVHAVPEKDNGEPIIGEFGKPPPLPREMPLQRLRRNLSELDAIMARLTEKQPSPSAHAACTACTSASSGQLQQATVMGRCPVVVGACAGVQETRGRSLLLPCAQNGVQRGWLEPRVLPVERRLDRPQPEREDVVGRQINDFIKARLGSSQAQVAAPPVLRTLSPVRRVLHPNVGVTAWQGQGQRLGTYQVPVPMAAPAPLGPGVAGASRARSTEPRGRCLAMEPRSTFPMPRAPHVAPHVAPVAPPLSAPSGPSRALSATVLTRAPAHVVMAVPAFRPLPREPSAPQKTVPTVTGIGKSMACPS